MGLLWNFLAMIWYQLTFKPKPLSDDIWLWGQTAIVTGSNAGLGFEAAKELALHGLSRLILGVRDAARGEAARAEIARLAPECKIEVWSLDQESWESIVAFGERVDRQLDRVDIALLNAGLKRLEFSQSPTGHEAHVQVNHLGTALLSLLLVGRLRRTARETRKPGRMSITASSVAFWARLSDVQEPQGGNGILAWLDNPASFVPGENHYCVSKLLNVLWTRALAIHLYPRDIVLNTFNPGYCRSQFHREDPRGESMAKYLAFDTAQGGYHLTDAVIRHPNSHGAYLSEQTIRPVPQEISSAKGMDSQQFLWDETLALFERECPEVDIEEFRRG
ncbi:NAD(P)-binding protein [Durotheca rogersii]|uniref:NAD(P)-binding protein n=1 Tax=Durotheca rogersii TaxID=419775 RepID=UPI002220D270|nr:NAD(P)-binding protein [Durotheca rogersii]KAI5865991.1 NAD(P)-binding protein [Durotheca rogersii]